MKRAHHLLQQQLNYLQAKPISASDGPGYLYNFFETPSQVKVGRSVDPEERKVQWDRVCWNPNRMWEKPIWCPYTHRAGEYHLHLYHLYLPATEAIAHLLLKRRCFDRPNHHCLTCMCFPFPFRTMAH